MSDKVLHKMIEDVQQMMLPNDDEQLCFAEIDCKPATFTKDKFYSIEPRTDEHIDIHFIDGGSAEIFSTPDTCINFIPIFHTVYRDNKRIRCAADEFYTLCQARMKDKAIVFSAKLYRSNINSLTDAFFSENFSFDPLDGNLLQQNSRLTISKVPGMIRRIAELSTALILASKAKEKDIVVIDGDLSTKLPDERKLIAALNNTAHQRNIQICGIAKTSNLLTSSGRSVADALSDAAPHDVWFYSPAARRQETMISFAKLNKKSDYIFKVETSSAADTGLILSFLAANSTDAVFLGYPYGLIEADRFARISNREKEMLRTTFMAKSGKGWGSLERSESALNAHSILDSI